MKLKTLLMAVVVLMTSSAALAQRVYPEQNHLERRVSELERAVQMQNRRIIEIERYLEGTPTPTPQTTDVSCMLVDSAQNRTFLGKGRNKLEAEGAVRKTCSQSVNPLYCGSAVKCSSGLVESARGYVCLVTDVAQGKTFTGEGSNAVEAEAKAKQSCQSSVNALYCGSVKTRCEAF